MNSDIDVDVRESGLVWITINRPQKHNALAKQVLAALADAVADAGRDQRTLCIVLRGAGDKYFAAGGDLVELASVKSDEQINDMADRSTEALDAIRDCPIPVVAYVNGDALGGGAELAVCCDMRLFAAHARIGFVQGRLGISSAWGGGPDLCNLVGPARTMRMMARCEMVGAEQALDWGLADLVVADGSESGEVQAFVKPLLERSRVVLTGIKAQTSAWRKGLPRAERRAVERRNILATWSSPEHWAAVDRFLAKEKS